MVKEKTEYDKIFQLDKGADTWGGNLAKPHLILASHPNVAPPKINRERPLTYLGSHIYFIILQLKISRHT